MKNLLYHGQILTFVVRRRKRPTGQNQTADLAYINHGYYIEGTYDHTVTNTSDISELNGDTTSETTTWYDLSGRKLNGKPTKKGIYINNERKYIVK